MRGGWLPPWSGSRKSLYNFCVNSPSASRAKLSAVKTVSKLRGTANHTLYPQPEGQLGECMAKYGKELGDDSIFCEGGGLHLW